MNILYIQKVKGIYGSEKVIMNSSAELKKRGHEVDYLLYSEPGYPVNDFIRLLQEKGISATEIVMRHNVSLNAFLRTMKFLKKKKYDIIHTHLIHGDMYGIPAAVLCGQRHIVSTKHNDDPFRKRLFFKFTERLLSRFCSKVITVSEWLRNLVLKRGIPFNKIHVIHNGIPAKKRTDTPKDTIRKSLGIHKDNTVFLIAARLIKQKGHEYLLDAFKELLREKENVILLIAGTGGLDKELKKKMQIEGLEQAVMFLGYRNDLSDIMHASDVFVHPSLWEGFGIVFLEAMQAGLPVIATRVSAIPEIVINAETGFLVEPRDVRTLCEKMKLLAHDTYMRKEFGERGRKRVEEHFSLKKMVDSYEQIYQDVLSARG